MYTLSDFNRMLLIGVHEELRAEGIATPMKDAMVFETSDEGVYEFMIPHLDFKCKVRANDRYDARLFGWNNWRESQKQGIDIMNDQSMTEQEKVALIYLLKDWAKSKGWVYSWIGEAIRVDVLTEAHFTDDKGDHHNILITYDWVASVEPENPGQYNSFLWYVISGEHSNDEANTPTLGDSQMYMMIKAPINYRVMAHALMRGFKR